METSVTAIHPREIVGIGQHFARIHPIFPMPWDIPMMAVVLGDGMVRRR